MQEYNVIKLVTNVIKLVTNVIKLVTNVIKLVTVSSKLAHESKSSLTIDWPNSKALHKILFILQCRSTMLSKLVTSHTLTLQTPFSDIIDCAIPFYAQNLCEVIGHCLL